MIEDSTKKIKDRGESIFPDFAVEKYENPDTDGVIIDSVRGKLRRVNEMMRQINEAKGLEGKSEDSVAETSADDGEDGGSSIEDLELSPTQLKSLKEIDKNTVSFKKKKEDAGEERDTKRGKVETSHRKLKEWTAEGVKNDPGVFVGDVLNNINRQIELKKELKIPRKALGIVLQLLKRKYSRTDEFIDIEKNKIILDEAEKNLLGDDVDLILHELRNVESDFRIDKIFNDYVAENPKTIKESNFEINGKVFGEESEIVTGEEKVVRSGQEKLYDSVNDIKEKMEERKNISSSFGVTGESSIGELLERRRKEITPLKGDTLPKIAINDISEIEETSPKKTFEQVQAELITKQRVLDEKNIPDTGISEKNLGKYSSVAMGKIESEESSSSAYGETGYKKVESNERKNILNKTEQDTQEREKKKTEYLEMVKELIDLDIKLEELKKERIKKESISDRLSIKKRDKSELENEYKKVQQDYTALRRKLSKEAGYSEEDIDEKVIGLRREVAERKSRFNLERASEYIQHLKKIVEYQKDSLPKNKKELFEKIVATAKDKRTQMLISALMLGISITVPEVGGAAWLTHGVMSGFFPVGLGMSLKYAGTGVGGYLFGDAIRSLLSERKGKIAEIEKKIVERANKFAFSEKENVFEFKSGSKNVRSASFFNKFDESRIRNNFIEAKKQILES